VLPLPDIFLRRKLRVIACSLQNAGRRAIVSRLGGILSVKTSTKKIHMKNKMRLLLTSVAIAGMAVVLTACAHVREYSRTEHHAIAKAIATPPGWTVSQALVTNTATGNQVSYLVTTAPGTNQTGFLANLFAPRPRVFTSFEETWWDRSAGGGTFVFTDPSAQELMFTHTNQTALGGNRLVSIGMISSTVTTNDVAAIGAAGTAVGNVVGAAASAMTGSGAAVSTASGVLSTATNAVTK
jgi:hypothetical protein